MLECTRRISFSKGSLSPPLSGIVVPLEHHPYLLSGASHSHAALWVILFVMIITVAFTLAVVTVEASIIARRAAIASFRSTFE